MSPAMLIVSVIGVVAYVFVALALGYYTAVSLRHGSAQGLGWSFNRNSKAALFRFQVAGAQICCVYFAMQALGALYALIRA